MTDEVTNLKTAVGDWYREELGRLATRFAESGDLAALDFSELVRRAQIYSACETTPPPMADEGAVRLDPGTDDYVQLQRVAQAMRTRGMAVPESIRAALGEDDEA